MESHQNQKPITLNDALSLLVSDVDIFLLQNKEQTADLDKLYTKDEIREQLKSSKDKIQSIISELTFANIELPLIGALNAYNVLLNTTLSDDEVIKFRKSAIKAYQKSFL